MVHLLAESFSVRVAVMPPGEDPDSMIRTKGPDAFRERIAAAKDFFDHQMDSLAAHPDFQTPKGKMQAARKMAEFISLIRDAVLREAVLQRIAQRLEISVQEFVKLLRAPSGRTPEASTPNEAKTSEPIVMDPTLRYLAQLALRDAATREWILAEAWDTMLEGEPGTELLVKILTSDLDPNAMESLHVFLTGLSAEEGSVVAGLIGEEMPAHPLHTAHDCWRELERRRIRHRMDAVQARIRAPDLDAEEVAKMQKEILDLQKRLSDISRPLSPPL